MKTVETLRAASEYSAEWGVLCERVIDGQPADWPGLPVRRRVVLLAMPPVRELDLAGIVEVFISANALLPEDRHYSVEIVSTEVQGRIEGMHGLHFVGGQHYLQADGVMDTLVVCGGIGVRNVCPADPVVSWLRNYEPSIARIASVCTGSFLLGHAGLLDGRRATTHWQYARLMAEIFPMVKVDADPIWIRDGKFYTSAGVSAGIDLCLAMIEEDHGRRIALAVARVLVVFLCRPGNQAQFSLLLKDQSSGSTEFGDLKLWMLEHLGADLSVPVLAARMAMSERHFQRVFTREIGKPPARFVEELRVEAVRRRLENSSQGLKEIAAACGFRSADVMSRSFQRLMKSTPAEYRARFRTATGSPAAQVNKDNGNGKGNGAHTDGHGAGRWHLA